MITVSGSDSVKDKCSPWCSLDVTASYVEDDDIQDTVSLKIGAVAEDQILVLDLFNVTVDDADDIVGRMNYEMNVDDQYWFRKLHIQPKQDDVRDNSVENSVMFVTLLDLDRERFLDNDEAKEIFDDLSNTEGTADINTDIDVNNNPDLDNNNDDGGDGNNGAVIALSVVLALVLLSILAVAVYIKRR